MIPQDIQDRATEMERCGLRYCFTCSSWEDDTDCFPDDHSRHCGHELKLLGFEMAMEYRLICTNDLRLIGVQKQGGQP